MITTKHRFYAITMILSMLFLLPACMTKKTVNEKAPVKNESNTVLKKGKKKGRRKKKKDTPKAPKKKTLRDMNYEELKAAAARSLESNDKSKAIIYKKKMVGLCDNPEDLCGLTIDIADHYFDLNDPVPAGKMYHEFVKLYPGDPKAEYALHRCVLCSFAQTLDPDRDQTKTKETIDLAESFLNRETFQIHRVAVEEILIKCRQRLFDSEAGIVNFYTHRGDYPTAQRRIDEMRVAFTPNLKDADVQILALEYSMAHKQDNKDMLMQKQIELAQLVGVEKAAVIVASLTPVTSFVNKF